MSESEKIRAQVKALKALSDIILEAIKEAGPVGIPSGHLYAMLIDKISLDVYTMIISILKQGGRITESGYVLKAVK